jgi:hypothetical protein
VAWLWPGDGQGKATHQPFKYFTDTSVILDTLDPILPKLQFTKNGLTTDFQHVVSQV